jgi:ribosomal protein S21
MIKTMKGFKKKFKKIIHLRALKIRNSYSTISKKRIVFEL